MTRKVNILVLYALADKDSVLDLLRHSDPLNEAFDVSFWHDDPVIPGQPWKTYFDSRIHHTDIVLLMLSDKFIDTQFIKQPQFKAVIDRHKENKTMIIPVFISECRADLDLELKEYEVDLSDFQVLPEGGKPMGDWESTDQVCKKVIEGLQTIITPFVVSLNQEGTKIEKEEKTVNDVDEQQEEEENDAISEDGSLEDTEAKRRAEVAKRIMEAAEASAKRRAEEDRLWEEAMAKRIAEKEKRIREGAETSASTGGEENDRGNLKPEEEIRKITGEADKNEERPEVALNIKTKQETTLKEERKAKRYAEEKKRIKFVTEAKEKDEGTHARKDNNIKKVLLKGTLVTLLIVAGIWIFSIFKTDSEELQPTLPELKNTDSKDSVALEKTNNNTLKNVGSSTNLGVGDIYNGGIIFVFNHSDNSGKIAHLEDAGPMPWQDAAKIHEQLGEGWRLPTFDELNLMYQTIGQGATNIGEFTGGLYWSATAFDEYQARLIRFSDGNTSYHYNKSVEHRKFKVRAIRDLGR